MVKYLVGILCSSNVPLLNESFFSVVNQENFDDYEIIIVVNTLNEEFYQDVMYEFGKHNYTKLRKIVRTESNGSPGKGHNSVLKIFNRDLRYDNLIILDGDDFLYPNALERIDNVYEVENSDIITLYGNTKVLINTVGYNKTDYDKTNLTTRYKLQLEYCIIEAKNIKTLSEEYNEKLATPGRVLSLNRKILQKYNELYDERMYTYDDFMYTVLFYKEMYNPEINITHLSDSYIYLYNAVNEESVSHKYATNSKNKYDKNDDKYKQDLLDTYIDKYNISETIIKPYNTIITDTIDVTNMELFHKMMILKLHALLPIKLPKKHILFIDYSKWDYYTINKRALGGTESAIYNMSNILSNDYNVSVMTKIDEIMNIHPSLSYYPLREEIVEKINPDIVIFQGLCPLEKSFFTNINSNIQLWNWIHHDTNVSFVTKEWAKFPYDKYIFVSNWQKCRYIQKFGFQRNKCITIQNGISPFIHINKLHKLKKEKTLIYYSAPYRGLIVAYQFFQTIKNIIPDIKFKIFSCFSREVDKQKSEYLPIQDVNEILITDNDVHYKSVYELLINDENIDFYGSVPQQVLFDHLKTSMILFYPNTYAETCCTSILEAMAYRCNIISSELGAIPETSNGFASLYNPHIDVLHEKIVADDFIINPTQNKDLPDSYKRQFITKTIELINNYYSDYNQQLLTNQQSYIKNCTWEKRAEIIKQYIPSV